MTNEQKEKITLEVLKIFEKEDLTTEEAKAMVLRIQSELFRRCNECGDVIYPKFKLKAGPKDPE